MKEQLLDTNKEGVTCQFSQPHLEIYLTPIQLSAALSRCPNRTEREHVVFYSWIILANTPECYPEHSANISRRLSQTHRRGQGPGLVDATNSPCREYRVQPWPRMLLAFWVKRMSWTLVSPNGCGGLFRTPSVLRMNLLFLLLPLWVPQFHAIAKYKTSINILPSNERKDDASTKLDTRTALL